MNEKFIAALAEALEMDATDIKAKDAFREYENYDSLTELSVLAMLDEEFGVEIEMKEYNTLNTVDDLFNRISKQD